MRWNACCVCIVATYTCRNDVEVVLKSPEMHVVQEALPVFQAPRVDHDAPPAYLMCHDVHGAATEEWTCRVWFVPTSNVTTVVSARLYVPKDGCITQPPNVVDVRHAPFFGDVSLECCKQ